MELNREQQNIFDHFFAGNIFSRESKNKVFQIVAGAGSGKTHTLTKVAAAAAVATDPALIILLTFTKKAAREMKTRLGGLGERFGFIGTIHAFSYRVAMAENPNRKIRLIKNAETIKLELARQIMPELNSIASDQLNYKVVLNPQALLQWQENYRDYKKRQGVVDFDDLILMAQEILQGSGNNIPLQLLMVDEFQDTSPDQLNLIKQIKAKNLFIVGDAKQSIYAFRGADLHNFVDFKRHFPLVQRMQLRRNYRSSQKILRLCNQFANTLKDPLSKKLTYFKAPGSKPTLCIFPSLRDIGDCLFYFLKKFPGFYTILVRTNFQKGQLQQVLTQNHLLRQENFQILTAHGAKGLEFDKVIIWDVAFGSFPHKWNDINEERRIFYVAMTRAISQLFFFCQQKQLEQAKNFNPAQNFLAFLENKCQLQFF